MVNRCRGRRCPAARRPPRGRGATAADRHLGRLVVDQRRLRVRSRGRPLVVIRLRAHRFLGVVRLAMPRRLDSVYSALPGALPQPSPRGQIYLEVDEAHQQQRDEEGAERGVDHVSLPSGQLAGCARFQLLGPVIPAGQRGRADRARQDPHPGYGCQNSLQGAFLRVIDGVGDRPVSVEGDGAQIQYARRAAEHVAG